jgi:hypothetical protein
MKMIYDEMTYDEIVSIFKNTEIIFTPDSMRRVIGDRGLPIGQYRPINDQDLLIQRRKI